VAQRREAPPEQPPRRFRSKPQSARRQSGERP
jgi:hypothetical protein